MRTSGARMAANTAATRQAHLDYLNQIIVNNPIVLAGNLDETSTADRGMVDTMQYRAMSNHVTVNGGQAPQIPAVEFGGHMTLCTGFGIRLKDGDVNSSVVEAAPHIPSLHIFPGATSACLPDVSELLPGSWVTCHESGSMTLETFEQYLREAVIPWCKTNTPGGLQKGVREALIVIDMPSVHDISAELRQELDDLGIHLYAFPANTSSWSQPCDTK